MSVELHTSPNTKYSNVAFAKQTREKLLLMKGFVIIKPKLSASFELRATGTLVANLHFLKETNP